MVAGGRLASLSLAVAGGLAWFLLRGTDPWDFLAAVTGMISLAIAIATLIPASFGPPDRRHRSSGC